MALESWALPRLSNLLPLDEESLKQVIEYTLTLSKDEAASHLKNLLGDSPAALEFITSFNSRRPGQAQSFASAASAQQEHGSKGKQSAPPHDGVPKPKKKSQKQKQNTKLGAPRRPDDWGHTDGSYMKPELEDYMSATPKSQSPHGSSANVTKKGLQPPSNAHSATSSRSATPLSSANISRTSSPKPPSSKLPPSAQGSLISDIPTRASNKSNKTTKISLGAGGTAPRGPNNTPLSDLDSAIRELELQTNPTRADDPRRKCNCMAQRHPLLAAAPNCLSCGKIICAKEGLGPCTFCGAALLSREDLQEMLHALKEERGRERMAANNAAHRKADVARTPRAFTAARTGDEEQAALEKATAQRDRLLSYQANNARRTRVHDEAADFEVPPPSLWATPAERAKQLRKQQEYLRQKAWRERPEWEKRKVVAEIDISKGKVIKKMKEVEMPEMYPSSEEETEEAEDIQPGALTKGQGAYGRNPLLGKLIKPVAKQSKGKGKAEAEGSEAHEQRKATMWRRVQDDYDDNEEWILDGGALAGKGSTQAGGEAA
jgi:hypothetical protein